jgi:hypothetical protein
MGFLISDLLTYLPRVNPFTWDKITEIGIK